jgi:hypothetical protein
VIIVKQVIVFSKRVPGFEDVTGSEFRVPGSGDHAAYISYIRKDIFLYPLFFYRFGYNNINRAVKKEKSEYHYSFFS